MYNFVIVLIILCKSYLSGGWSAIWDPNSYTQSVSGYVTGWSVQAYPILWPRPQRVLLWPPSELFRGHHILLPERRKAEKAGQCASGCVLGRNSVLWTGRVCHHKVQVKNAKVKTFLWFEIAILWAKEDFFSTLELGRGWYLCSANLVI